jgi:2-polyprenyl-3-methyl-5-hydroxy-6-metoxy-1,4-benzoquinol methylase
MGVNGSSACKVCGAAALEEIPEFAALPRITSDCVPFRTGGSLAVCGHCGGAQAIAGERWLADIGEIYGKYQIYHQSGGVEQYVLDPRAGALRPRSEVLAERLAGLPAVPRSGSLLDVGCGTGGTLRAFAARGGWELYGLEMDERNLPFVGAVPGFVRLYNCQVRELPRQFDLITMVHSLEHFPEPHEVLTDLQGKLSAAGKLFIEVPNGAANPFEYVVADHMVHFSPETLAALLERAGFGVDCLATDWVTKELSAVAHPASGDAAPARRSGSVTRVRQQIAWLEALSAAARDAAGKTASFGLFGTAIAAAWLWQSVGDRVEFFVDEDIHRIGRTYLGRPVLRPDQAPPGSLVFLGLIPRIASAVRAKLQHLPLELRMPPPFGWEEQYKE